MGEDEASAPLVASSQGGSRINRNGSSGWIWTRMLWLVLAVVLVVVSVLFESQVQSLQYQLEQEESKIQELQHEVEDQSKMITRFNQSVTNQDVLQQLNALAKNLKTTEETLKAQLQLTETDISTKLESTLQQLGETVTAAEQQIEDEVNKVKVDVDQYVRNTQDQFSMENSFMVYQLAGTITLLSCLISMWHMTAHLRKFLQPHVQRKILAILWMPPIYAITSWFSLVFHQAEGYLAILKDAYEAYIIYQFLSFCIAVLGKGDRNAVVNLLARRADHLSPPLRFCFCCRPDAYDNPRELADAILLQCQVFALQFVLFRPLTTMAMVVLNKYKYYGGADNPHDYRAPQFYIAIIQNLSVFTAFTGLLKFYHAVDKDLEWCRPFPKFLCIKGVVFMTFWQGLAITVLASTTDVGGNDIDEWAASAQNFLICLEMLLFSVAHFYCFPTEEWAEGYRASHSKGQFGDSMALGDFFQDVKLILRSNNYKRKAKKNLDASKTPTIQESSSTDDEEEGIESESVISELTDDGDKAIARALARSLEEAEDAPEIQEAKKRLLRNKVFRRDDADEDGSTRECSDDLLLAESGLVEDESLRENQDALLSVETLEDANVPNETTGLLSGGRSGFDQSDNRSENDEILRPSVFTTIAAVASRPTIR